ncbi:hypothetical protein [Kosakonia cowanii]|uniref:hypothetical protein n=1 Tax=Kosakonia cowanii TaxID=208223 RepID=UPI0012FDCAB7|nr:hypothetical protein [Kosakonia cowanii]
MSTVPENCLMALRLSGLQNRTNPYAGYHPAMSAAPENCLMALRLSGLQNSANP